MDRSKYPADWEAISQRIRFERAGGKCETCGVVHGAVGARDKHGVWHDEHSIHCMSSGCGISLFGEDFPDMIKIVLTTAHLDHDPSNNDDSNLRALCQRCHLQYDAPVHAQHAAETRRRKRVAAFVEGGNVPLFEDISEVQE